MQGMQRAKLKQAVPKVRGGSGKEKGRTGEQESKAKVLKQAYAGKRRRKMTWKWDKCIPLIVLIYVMGALAFTPMWAWLLGPWIR